METEIKIIANFTEEQLEVLLSEIKNTSEIIGVKLKIESNKIIQNDADSKILCGWVDVRDSLPNHSKEVLIIDANYDDYYGIGAYRKNDGWALQGTNFWKPTHWKELDKPSVGK